MIFEHVEKLKNEYTDKYVLIDDSRPELQRFRGMTGTVRTVNMSGRALVEFDGYENIGWYDIEIDFLKVIDQPLPKEEPKAKSAPKKAPLKPAAKKVSPAKKKVPATDGEAMSVADILAAARGSDSQGAAKQASPAAKTSVPNPEPGKPATGQPKVDLRNMSVEEVLAAARGEKLATKQAGSSVEPPAPASKAPAAAQPSKTPEKADGKKMTVEEMLAAARAEKMGAAKPAVAAPAKDKEDAEAKPPAEQAADEVELSSDGNQPEPSKAPTEPGDNPTETADIVAWCRQRDAN